MALAIICHVSMLGPEICDPQDLLEPVIPHVPLHSLLTHMSSSGGTVNGVGGKHSILIGVWMS